MRALLALRITLAISALVFLAILGAGAMGLISEATYALGLVAGSLMIVSAAGCVVTQVLQMISNKRRKVHG